MCRLLKFAVFLICIKRGFPYTAIPKAVLAFVENELVPDVLETPPPILLGVHFNSGTEAQGGNEIPSELVQQQPQLTWQADVGRLYTIIFIDPDVLSRDNAQCRSFLHWLVVNIPGNNIKSGQTLAYFISSMPRPGTGLHRYVFLVYEQPRWINLEELPNLSNLNKRAHFSPEGFSRRFNLGTPVAGNLYQSKNYGVV